MAKGSHATWSPGDSRTCIICGKKIALLHGAWIHYDRVTDEHTSAHLHCGPPLTKRMSHIECGPPLTERTTMTEVDETSPSETQPEPEPYPPNPEPEPEPPDTEDEPEQEEDVA